MRRTESLFSGVFWIGALWILFGVPVLFLAVVEGFSGGKKEMAILFWAWVVSGPALIGRSVWRTSKRRESQAREQTLENARLLKRQKGD